MADGLETFPCPADRGVQITIKDIASFCGVSVSTVSRVLNEHPNVSAEARERVLRAIREHHYVPNSSARDLVRVESDAVGLVLRGVSNSFFAELLTPLERVFMDSGYTTVVQQIPSGRNELEAAAQLARAKRLKGVVLLGGSFDYSPEQAAILNVPFVLCTYTNSFGSLAADQYSSVTIDDRRTGWLAARTLLERGHRRIAVLLDSVHDRSISELRWLGFRQALEEAGADFDPALLVETVSFDMQSAYRSMKRVLAAGTEFTAVFAVSDTMAIAAIRALHEAGKRVPDDCSVVGVDGIALTQYTIPALTTFVQPQRELAESAARMLIELIEGRSGNRQIVLDTTLRPGESIRRI